MGVTGVAYFRYNFYARKGYIPSKGYARSISYILTFPKKRHGELPGR